MTDKEKIIRKHEKKQLKKLMNLLGINYYHMDDLLNAIELQEFELQFYSPLVLPVVLEYYSNIDIKQSFKVASYAFNFQLVVRLLKEYVRTSESKPFYYSLIAEHCDIEYSFPNLQKYCLEKLTEFFLKSPGLQSYCLGLASGTSFENILHKKLIKKYYNLEITEG